MSACTGLGMNQAVAELRCDVRVKRGGKSEIHIPVRTQFTVPKQYCLYSWWCNTATTKAQHLNLFKVTDIQTTSPLPILRVK